MDCTRIRVVLLERGEGFQPAVRTPLDVIGDLIGLGAIERLGAADTLDFRLENELPVPSGRQLRGGRAAPTCWSICFWSPRTTAVFVSSID